VAGPKQQFRVRQRNHGLLCRATWSDPLAVASTQESFLATNSLRSDFWESRWAGHALLRTNGIVYVGGSFSYVAPKRSKVACHLMFIRSDRRAISTVLGSKHQGDRRGRERSGVGLSAGTSRKLDRFLEPIWLMSSSAGTSVCRRSNFHPIKRHCAALALQRIGKIVCGGDFTSIGGELRSRIAPSTLPGGHDEQLFLPWAPKLTGRFRLAHATTRLCSGIFNYDRARVAQHIAALDAG